MKNIIKMSALKQGDSARVVGFEKKMEPAHRAYRAQLLAMGLIPDTIFFVSRIAPLGDPIEITLRNYMLSLRKDEACILNIERIYDEDN